MSAGGAGKVEVTDRIIRLEGGLSPFRGRAAASTAVRKAMRAGGPNARGLRPDNGPPVAERACERPIQITLPIHVQSHWSPADAAGASSFVVCAIHAISPPARSTSAWSSMAGMSDPLINVSAVMIAPPTNTPANERSVS